MLHSGQDVAAMFAHICLNSDSKVSGLLIVKGKSFPALSPPHFPMYPDPENFACHLYSVGKYSKLKAISVLLLKIKQIWNNEK